MTSTIKEQYKALQRALKRSDLAALSQWLSDRGFSQAEVSKYMIFYNDLVKRGCKRLSQFKKGTVITTKSGKSWVVTESSRTSDSSFDPDLTPDMMLRLGVFGGKYINGWEEDIPLEWIFMSIACRKLAIGSTPADKSYNFYSVTSYQNLDEWKRNGWLHDQDPLGWFQWYIRYYLGRRTEDDARQKARWISFKRHVFQIQANSGQARLRQRQACVQWAYNPDKGSSKYTKGKEIVEGDKVDYDGHVINGQKNDKEDGLYGLSTPVDSCEYDDAHMTGVEPCVIPSHSLGSPEAMSPKGISPSTPTTPHVQLDLHTFYSSHSDKMEDDKLDNGKIEDDKLDNGKTDYVNNSNILSNSQAFYLNKQAFQIKEKEIYLDPKGVEGEDPKRVEGNLKIKSSGVPMFINYQNVKHDGFNVDTLSRLSLYQRPKVFEDDRIIQPFGANNFMQPMSV